MTTSSTSRKAQTLQQAATRLERLLAGRGLSTWDHKQVEQAHREIKQVRSRLQHEALITRISERFLTPRK